MLPSVKGNSFIPNIYDFLCVCMLGAKLILIKTGRVVKHAILDRSNFLTKLNVCLINLSIYLFIKGLLNTCFTSGYIQGNGSRNF